MQPGKDWDRRSLPDVQIGTWTTATQRMDWVQRHHLQTRISRTQGSRIDAAWCWSWAWKEHPADQVAIRPWILPLLERRRAEEDSRLAGVGKEKLAWEGRQTWWIPASTSHTLHSSSIVADETVPSRLDSIRRIWSAGNRRKRWGQHQQWWRNWLR